jgi:hypothetical protein
MTTQNTPAALTYGDTFTLPSAPGIVWEIRDRRTTEDPNANPPAEAVPITQDGEPVTYDTALRIGRAERVGLSIKISRQMYDPAHPLRAYLAGRAWETRPTDAQEKMIDADAAALTFNLPPLTGAETVARVVARAHDAYIYSAVRDAVDALNLPKPYSSSSSGYRAVMDALHADPATIPAIRAALVASFTAELEKWNP